MALFQVCFEFPVEPVAVNGEASPSPRIWAVRDWAAVDEVGSWCHVVMSAISTAIRKEGAHEMLLFEGHIISASPRGVLQEQLLLLRLQLFLGASFLNEFPPVA